MNGNLFSCILIFWQSGAGMARHKGVDMFSAEGFPLLPADTVTKILAVKVCTHLFVWYIHLRRKKCTFIEETKMIRLIEANSGLQTVQSRVLRQYLKMLKTANNNRRMCFVFVCQFTY